MEESEVVTQGKSTLFITTALMKLTLVQRRNDALVKPLPFQQCGPGSISGVDATSGLSLLLVSGPCPKAFFPGFSDFPPSTKTNMSRFQFHLETVAEDPLRGWATTNSN